MAELLNSGIWHLIGIGGIGVSGVARLLQSRGKRIVPVHPRGDG